MRVRYYVRPGLGDVTSSITDAAVASLTPAIKDIMQTEVMPMLAVSLIAGAVLASAIGSWFATRPSRASGVRRNPVPHVAIRYRRRSA
jgi:uncharacterized membrane protein YfcA